jgi:hypothetical protein
MTVDAPTEQRRRPKPSHMVVAGIPAMAVGIVLQIMTATETLTCRLETSAATPATASCVISRRVLFGLVPIGTEAVAGVHAARNRSGNSLRRPERRVFHVVLDGASGEYVMAGSRSNEAVGTMIRNVNEALRTRAPRFELSLGFVLEDAFLRLGAVLVTLFAAGFVAAGLAGLRRPH